VKVLLALLACIPLGALPLSAGALTIAVSVQWSPSPDEEPDVVPMLEVHDAELHPEREGSSWHFTVPVHGELLVPVSIRLGPVVPSDYEYRTLEMLAPFYEADGTLIAVAAAQRVDAGSDTCDVIWRTEPRDLSPEKLITFYQRAWIVAVRRMNHLAQRWSHPSVWDVRSA
jgi:hypothetical protein